ncbi:MAG: 3-alpha,7-alpha,12-alpha-trihydroxy-5-beta-cholest-24-enoyl-CoA hydratase [Deltaproteobacteria bacterium]|nr:3-alpha,7-alpha,12-alpha-trihydroxy-5-beta-cholest-24-enoyl-CoA hydratase [Deltaproteobacteria bacterium]
MPIDQSIVGRKLDAIPGEWTEKDVMLYALGVGETSLPFCYERDLRVLPTFAVVPPFPAMFTIGGAMNVNPMMILHGEQRIELAGPIPARAKVTSQPQVVALYDKVKGAVVVADVETRDEKGNLLFKNTFTVFARGEGGFGGDRGPSGAKNEPPSRAPDAVEEMTTAEHQALLYRLSGDTNPLHADPDMAALGGYPKPILHGLCTFGHVGRAILHRFCGSDPARFKDFEVRFSGVVYPGETIVTEMWCESSTRVIVQAKTRERGEVVLSSAAATIAG